MMNSDTHNLFPILVNTIPDYWEWHILTNHVFVDPYFYKKLGYEITDSDELSNYWRQLVFQEDLEVAQESLNNHLHSDGKIPYEATLRFLHKDGSIIYVLSKGQIAKWDKQGTPTLFTGIYFDISSLMKIQDEVKKNNQRLELIVDGIDAGIWEWDMESGKNWWSTKFYQLLGYQENDIIPSYDTFMNGLLHPEDKEKVEKAIKLHLETASPYKLEVRLKHKNSTYYWFETSGKALFNNQNKPIQMCGSIIDITEKKLLQLELAESEFLLQEVSKMSKAGGWEYDLATQSLRWSQALYDIWQMPDDFIPTAEQMMNRFIPPHTTLIKQKVKEAIETGKPWDEEFQIITGQGNIIWVRTLGKPIFDNTGKITGLRGATQNIQEQKKVLEELQTYFEISVDALNIANFEGYFTQVSPAFTKMLGFSKEEILAIPFLDLIHPDDLESTQSELQTLNLGIPTLHFTNRYRTKDGQYLWLEWTSVTKNEKIYAIARDITDRKEAERLLQQSKTQLQLFISQSPSSLAMLDTQLDYLAASERWLTYYGLNPEKYLGQNHYQLLPFIAEMHRASHESCLAGNVESSEEEYIIREDGTTVWMRWEARPWYTLEGQIGGILLFTEDITSRKQAAEQIKENEEKFRTMFNLSPVGMALTDPKTGRYVEFNNAFAESTGYFREELKSMTFQDLTPPEYEDSDKAQIILAGETGQYGPYEKEYITKSGERITVLMAGIIIKNQKGEGYVWSFIQDISQLKKREQKINLLLDELVASNLQKDKLFSVIAHDLRGLIGKINTLLEFSLSSNESLPSDLQELLSLSQLCSVNAKDLLEDLLLWAQSQFQKVSFEPELCTVLHIAKSILEHNQYQILAKNIVITNHISPDLIAFTDESMLKVILRNLLSNAIKFSKSGGEIILTANQQDRMILFSVKDHGVGISPQNLEKLFQKHANFTTYGTHGEKGSGIGLELCKGFIEKHGGQIWVSSELNQGTTFTFSLPLPNLA
ncbi:PAS domain S-box protein [Cytophagaceae bacterium YF14B1]|uniref:histidine kinase n=1 Tax=Xanthocytophaga flava TaxID=3048013 RepID=A0AAE3QWL0_9BACT|nr:PAS domain S-box protein [Xanthocytophaga flavus]MDJ1484540.1 PAS domain S-box protein [Xanthocytophaga flavus]